MHYISIGSTIFNLKDLKEASYGLEEWSKNEYFWINFNGKFVSINEDMLLNFNRLKIFIKQCAQYQDRVLFLDMDEIKKVKNPDEAFNAFNP